MSILYFKHILPRARIIGFEPSSDLIGLLRNNVNRKRLSKVKLINGGLGTREVTVGFDPETNSSSKLPFHLTANTCRWCSVYAKRLEGG
jgi:FkbM family methyltransferase